MRSPTGRGRLAGWLLVLAGVLAASSTALAASYHTAHVSAPLVGSGLVAAFLFGLLGSTHCFGMCGPRGPVRRGGIHPGRPTLHGLLPCPLLYVMFTSRWRWAIRSAGGSCSSVSAWERCRFGDGLGTGLPRPPEPRRVLSPNPLPNLQDAKAANVSQIRRKKRHSLSPLQPPITPATAVSAEVTTDVV